jgi:hypothetical protein
MASGKHQEMKYKQNVKMVSLDKLILNFTFTRWMKKTKYQILKIQYIPIKNLTMSIMIIPSSKITNL